MSRPANKTNGWKMPFPSAGRYVRENAVFTSWEKGQNQVLARGKGWN